MGLAASQARLLTITARKSDCEYESMILSHQKIALSREMSQLSAEYDDAIQQTKLIYDYYGQTSETTPLNYSLMMTPSALNNYTPLLVTDNGGRVVLDGRLAKAARDAGIPQEGLDGLPSSDLRNAFIDSLASTGYISQNTAENISVKTDDSELFRHMNLSVMQECKKTCCKKVIGTNTNYGVLPTPTRAYHHFLGWYTDPTGGIEVTPETVLSDDITVYAHWQIYTYTISYNANGGSGAPSSQTKTYGTTLKLSSTKPKRTGYTFQGWGTSATDTSVNYAAGANYTSNANITLYAIWEANTYTVKYNANGGSGAPGNQTKTYGKTLTLSSTKPTRTNYIFKGWGTSASSTTVSYAAGASYTSNASITLYAIWELAYVNPRINNLSIDRCTSSGVYKDDGTYARVKFGWQCDQSATSCYIEWNSTQNGSLQKQTVTVSGTSGNVDAVVGNNWLDVELTWSFKVYLADSSGNTTEKFTLSSMHYEIDFLGGGGGVAIGMAAVREGFDVDMEAYFRKGIFVSNGSVSQKVLDMASDGTPEVKWGIDGLGGNIMNPIWSGTWSSGSISVPMILYYKIILVRTNYANGLCIPMYRGLKNTNDFCGIGGFPYLSDSGINAFWLYGIHFTVDNSANLTLEKAHRFSIYADGSNPGNNTNISITEIYGVL